ncbi:hypothetical protein Q5H93_06160 [Hymenobacter sp. ASUV-10]|uniref:Uncharacterized protein n=1 Tax=Hymenobacter aranciens TaxID=3063996 RepID=A0ABT9B7Q7_9BACT|nr:hypothetical protein [Hymenobacter sp. ASUV-10]MDO7874309.1 hypothetical protein [Hymenobacter sp. ASUV-10]
MSDTPTPQPYRQQYDTTSVTCSRPAYQQLRALAQQLSDRRQRSTSIKETLDVVLAAVAHHAIPLV